MQRVRQFFYVCAGVFLLVLSYHLGVSTATAQQRNVIAGFAIDRGTLWVITDTGGVFAYSPEYGGKALGNFWSHSFPSREMKAP